jgi:hypothetical protein
VAEGLVEFEFVLIEGGEGWKLEVEIDQDR